MKTFFVLVRSHNSCYLVNLNGLSTGSFHEFPSIKDAEEATDLFVRSHYARFPQGYRAYVVDCENDKIVAASGAFKPTTAQWEHF